ncbi:MAG: class I SAM-dependent methyltransferase [Sphingosinicella sp.]|uniref:class I SAM-dependent methyltransferase n=1 Tax=Sphingosinicella sp. TaxID=1917971 RepID=UPI004037D658
MLKRALLAAILAASPVVLQAQAPDFATAVSAPGRPDTAVALDEVRRPAEVLRWLGLGRGDRVLDYFAGTGYYTEIMARAVGPTGSVTGWNTPFFAGRPQIRDALAAIRQRQPNTAFFSSPNTALSFPDDTYDFVLLHLVYHDAYWESTQFSLPRIDPNTVTQALFRATRPGGIVAVIDHVAAPGRETRAEVEATHRILPETVRADFERAGFVFDGESDLLRNPQDDRSVNVFNPSIRGRTDRFVYRFRRPAR